MYTLKPNMYVRTKNGTIAKIVSKEDVSASLHREEIVFILDNGNRLALHSKKVVKASHNIINLIEVGDYVNGEKVTSIIPPDILADEELDHAYISSLNGEEVFEDIEIQSIVTKEQFESMKYEL